MAAGTAADGDQAVGAGFERLLGVPAGGDVVKADPSVVVDLAEHVLGGALGGEVEGYGFVARGCLVRIAEVGGV